VAAGSESFLSSLLAVLNTDNALAMGQAFVQLDLEAVRAARPDVIIELTMDEAAPEDLWQPLSTLPSPPRIVHLTSDVLLRPGPRLLEGLALLAQALRPKP